MRAKPEYRNRDETEVVVLDALADRHQEGMTVFEIRSRADVTIDQIEDALAALKDDDLIVVEENDERTVILPEEDVVGPVKNDEETSLLEAIRRRLPPAGIGRTFLFRPSKGRRRHTLGAVPVSRIVTSVRLL